MTRILIHRCYAIYNENKRTVTADNFPDVMDCSDKYGEIEWQEMLGFLNEKQRIVVELYYGQQFKVREIAGALQIGQSAVKSRLQSARKTLEQFYEIGKKHHLTATDAYELEGFIMDRFTKWLGNIRRTDEVPDAVKQTVCDTLQNLPDAPERKIENRTWKHLAVAACVVILICGSVLAVNPSLAANLPILGTIFKR